MTSLARECVVFSGEQLLPAAWKPIAVQGAVRTFNPGLLRDGNGWIFAYRIVGADGLRRIAMCRLNSALQIVEGSQVAWSDHVTFRKDRVYPGVATCWFADPRLYIFGDQSLIYWNSGWHEPRNCQFVQAFDRATLLPLGDPRELLLRGERRKLEKNWTFFSGVDARLRAVYSVQPHCILEFSLAGGDDIWFEETARVEWSIPGYPANHGGLRGGAPPVLADGEYWSFCHSVHDGADGYNYLPAAYSFAAEPPFAPTSQPTRSLELGNPSGAARTHARLNPAVDKVIYPCGAARDGARWLISHGINDELSAISIVEHAAVLASLQPMRRVQ
jgi:hypothetical protein